MKLIQINPDLLAPGQPLPCSLRDAAGRVLLQRGLSIADEAQLSVLAARRLFVDEAESDLMHRRLNAQVDEALRGAHTTLGKIAAIQPSMEGWPADPAKAPARPLEWPDLEGRARVLLGDTKVSGWVARVDELADQMLAKLDQHVDATLMRFIHMAGTQTENYSTHHGILVMMLCALAGHRLPGWTDEWRRPLTRAALTMNVGMTTLQNELARQNTPVSANQRTAIDAHVTRGLAMLTAAGVDDPLWLEAVRHHHSAPSGPLSVQEPGVRLARLVMRADRYAARLSVRRMRAPLAAKAAAQAAFFDEGGLPDEAGQALLQETGLYPPGAWVKLEGGETALVMKRQPNPRAPLTVVSLINREGLPLAIPAVRNTALPKYKVAAAVSAAEIRLSPNLEALQKLI